MAHLRLIPHPLDRLLAAGVASMIRRGEGASTEVRSLFDQERRIAAVPQNVRRRTLSRVEAALRERQYEAAAPPNARSPARISWAVAAALIGLAGATGGAAAYAIAARAHRSVAAGAPPPPISSATP